MIVTWLCYNIKNFLYIFFIFFSVQKQSEEFGELEWLADVGLFGEQFPQETLAAAEVPQLPITHTSCASPYKAHKSYMSNKKPRMEVLDEDDEHCTVPDLG